jgi:hypothetical protein
MVAEEVKKAVTAWIETDKPTPAQVQVVRAIYAVLLGLERQVGTLNVSLVDAAHQQMDDRREIEARIAQLETRAVWKPV